MSQDIGPCKGRFTKWSFDTQVGKCKEFTFGGCEGNGNRCRKIIAGINRRPHSSHYIGFQVQLTGGMRDGLRCLRRDVAFGRSDLFLEEGHLQAGKYNLRTERTLTHGDVLAEDLKIYVDI